MERFLLPGERLLRFASGPRALALLRSIRYCLIRDYCKLPSRTWHSCFRQPPTFPPCICSYIGGGGYQLLLIQAAHLARKDRSGVVNCPSSAGFCWIGKRREFRGKTETGYLVACADAAVKVVAAVLPDVALSNLASALADTTWLVAVAVVLPVVPKKVILKLVSSCLLQRSSCSSALCLVCSASVFRTSPSTSTTAALLSSLAVVIQFSSLVVVTPCRLLPILNTDP